MKSVSLRCFGLLAVTVLALVGVPATAQSPEKSLSEVIALKRSGNKAEAIPRLKAMLSKNPQDAKAHYVLAWCLVDDRRDEAATHFQQAIEGKVSGADLREAKAALARMTGASSPSAQDTEGVSSPRQNASSPVSAASVPSAPTSERPSAAAGQSATPPVSDGGHSVLASYLPYAIPALVLAVVVLVWWVAKSRARAAAREELTAPSVIMPPSEPATPTTTVTPVTDQPTATGSSGPGVWGVVGVVLFFFVVWLGGTKIGHLLRHDHRAPTSTVAQTSQAAGSSQFQQGARASSAAGQSQAGVGGTGGSYAARFPDGTLMVGPDGKPVMLNDGSFASPSDGAGKGGSSNQNTQNAIEWLNADAAMWRLNADRDPSKREKYLQKAQEAEDLANAYSSGAKTPGPGWNAPASNHSTSTSPDTIHWQDPPGQR